MSTKTKVEISIYNVLDELDPNHWAIFLHNEDKKNAILQIRDDKNGVGYYVADTIYDKIPTSSSTLKQSIEVGIIEAKDHEQALHLIEHTKVDNASKTWNFQAWVVESLDRLVEFGIFQWDPNARNKIIEQRQHRQ